MHPAHLLPLLLLLSAPPPVSAHALPAGSPDPCVPPQPLTRSFCEDPPVVPNVDLFSYAGRWFQLFTSGVSTRLSEPDCVTANYTLLPDGSYEVKNCNYNPSLTLPDCGRGFATRRPGGRTSQLQVQLFPFIPPGDYNVAALIGRANVGYVAAAVYNCNVTETGSFEDGFFIIARTPFRPGLVKRILATKLRCKGYQLDKEFVPSGNGPECKYFFGPEGFDLRDAFAGIP